MICIQKHGVGSTNYSKLLRQGIAVWAVPVRRIELPRAKTT
jgi:hypothetical protein